MYRVLEHLPEDWQPDFEAPPQPEPTPAPAQQDQLEPAAVRSAQPVAPAQDTPAPQYKVLEHLPDDWQPDFEEAPAPDADKPGVLSNVARGIGERGLQLVGNTAGTAATTIESGGDWLAQNIGNIWIDQNNALQIRQMTPEETKGDNTWLSTKLREVQQGLANPDLGYDPSTTWDDVKKAPLRNIIPFALEQGIVSSADMVAAIRNPIPYIFEQSGEIGQQRAQNEGGREMTFGDVVKSLPAATISQWMEKIGTEKILGKFAGGEQMLTELKQLPVDLLKTLMTEGATEAAQQAAQYTGGTAFTDKGMDWWEMGEQVLQAGLVGAIFGPAARAPFAGLEIATAPKEEAAPVLPVGDEAPGAGVTATGGQPTPGNIGGSVTPPQPVGAGPERTAPTDAAKTPNPAKVTTPVITPNGIPDPTAAAAVNPQPMENPKTQPTPDTGEDYRKVTDPSFVEPMLPDEQDIFDEDEEPVEINFDEPAGNVAGAGTDTATAINAGTEAQPQTTAEAIQAGVDKIVEAVKQATPAPAPAPQPAAPMVEQPQPAASPVASATATDVATPAAGAEQLASPVTAQPDIQPEVQAQPEPTLEPEIGTEPEPAAVAPAKKSFWDQFPTQVGQAIDVGPVAGEQPQEETGEPLSMDNGPDLGPGPSLGHNQPEPEPAISKFEVVRKKGRGRVKVGPTAAERAAATVGTVRARTGGELHRALVDEARARAADVKADQEFANLADDQRFSDVVDAAAKEVAAKGKSDESLGGNVRALSQDMVDTVKRRMQEVRDAEKKRQEEAEVEAVEREADRRVQERAEHAAEADKTQRERGAKKSADATINEDIDTTRDTWKKEMEKPESERDPDLMEWGKAFEARKAFPPRSKRKVDVEGRKKQTDIMEAAQKRRVAKRRERDTAADEARRQNMLEQAREQLAEEERQRNAEEKTKAEQRAAEEKKIKEEDKARKEKTQPVLKRIIDALHIDPKKLTSSKTIAAFVTQVQSALKSLDTALGKSIDPARYSPEENLAIFAKRVLKNQEPGMGADEVAQAKVFLDAGDLDNFYSLIQENKQTEDTKAGSFNEAMHSTVEGGRRKPQASSDYSGSKALEGEEAAAQTADAGSTHTIRVKGVDHQITVQRTLNGWQAAHLARKLSPLRGVMQMFRRMHNRRLRDMVGDTQVMFVSAEDLAKLTGKTNAYGTFLTTGAEAVAAGHHGAVFIRSDIADHMTAHAIEHELTHAATDFAIRTNYRGTRVVLENMLEKFKKQLEFNGLNPADYYGTTNVDEFVAEAFSNQAFQQLLADHDISADLARQIGIPSDRRPTWWKAFTAAIRHALGLDIGGRGSMTYMEGVMALHPDLMMSLGEQQRMAQEDPHAFGDDYDYRPGEMNTSETFPGYDFAGMHLLNQSQMQARIDKRIGSKFFEKGRLVRNKFFMSTMEMMRHATRMLGDVEAKAYNTLAELMLSRDHMIRQLRQDGENTAAALNAMYRKSVSKAEAVVDSIYQSTLSESDPSKLLTDKENSHIAKSGMRDRVKRRRHREARAAYLALDADQKALWHNIIDFHRKQQDDKMRSTIHSIIEDAVAKGDTKLPRGVSVDDAAHFVLSGKIDENPAQWAAGSQEKQIYDSLGNVGKALKNSKGMRLVKGVYAPLTRQGKYFFTARETLATPAGATLLPQTDHEQVFAFRNKKDAQDYIDTTDHRTTGTKTRVVDKTTGKTTNAHGDKLTEHDPNTVKEYVVSAMDKSMHMGDNTADLENLRAHLKANGHTVEGVDILDQYMHGGSNSILPLNVRQLLTAIERSSKNDHVKAANRAAVMDAYVRSMAGSRAQHRTLKRIGMGGHSTDMVQSILSTNAAMAGHMANLHFMPKISAADDALDAQTEQMKKNSDPKLLEFREMIQELRKRRDAAYKYDPTHSNGFQRVANAALNASFMTRLASPSFAIFNQMQLFAVAGPVLAMDAGRGGTGLTFKHMTRALSDMNFGSTWGRGIKGTYNEAADLVKSLKGIATGKGNVALDNISHHQNTVDAITKNKANNLDTKLKGMERLKELGLSSDQGLDVTDMSEYGKTRAEIFIHRSARIARQLTEAVEAVNRHATFLTAIDNALATGKTEEQAIDYAVHAVEQTQGGYSAANNPTVMQHPFGRLALQFKKYGLMYGQLYWGNVSRALNINGRTSTEDRIQAAQHVAALSMMGVAMAGAMGLPIMEVARLGNVVAQMFGGDDWDKRKSDAELMLQRLFKTIGMGDVAGNKTAEVMMHGLSRLAGIDTQSRLSNDGLLVFSDPKSSSSNDIMLWLAKNVLGAPTQMVQDTYDAAHDGKMEKLPLPKFIKDGMKAYKMAYQGKKSPSGAKTYSEPTGLSPGTIALGTLGLSPSSAQRQYEAGGSYIKSKEDAAGKAERTSAVQSWLNAGSQAERDKAWKKIQSGYNKNNTKKITMSDLLKAKKRRDTTARKQAREEASP